LKLVAISYQRSNNRVAADSSNIFADMQRVLAAAERKRWERTQRAIEQQPAIELAIEISVLFSRQFLLPSMTR